MFKLVFEFLGNILIVNVEDFEVSVEGVEVHGHLGAFDSDAVDVAEVVLDLEGAETVEVV